MAAPQRENRLRHWLALPVAILICLAVSGLGAIATEAGPGSWYDGLAKAPWNPPAWVFAPVWTALYISLGFALWLIWKAPAGPGRSRALVLFFVQLGLNLAWSWIFFGLQMPLLALVDLVLLLGAIVATQRAAWWDVPFAGLIMLPYLGWCAFALTLNAAGVVLN